MLRSLLCCRGDKQEHAVNLANTYAALPAQYQPNAEHYLEKNIFASFVKDANLQALPAYQAAGRNMKVFLQNNPFVERLYNDYRGYALFTLLTRYSTEAGRENASRLAATQQRLQAMGGSLMLLAQNMQYAIPDGLGHWLIIRNANIVTLQKDQLQALVNHAIQQPAQIEERRLKPSQRQLLEEIRRPFRHRDRLGRAV